MKQLNSYRLFKKVVRKYYKRHDTRVTNIIKGKRVTSYWNCWNLWCYYLLKEEDYDNPLIRREFEWDMPQEEVTSYIENIKSLIGKNVYAYNITDKCVGFGILKGVALVNFGIMLVIETNNINEFYFSTIKLQEYEG